MSCDEQLGYVYLPFSTPSNDYYGGHRPGANLFGESLVALDARTGNRIWHFQAVHHGLWDYDLPAAPNLLDITVSGRRIKAVAQVSKQGFVYVFNRVTGEPVWPIEERPVPQSGAPGEKTSPTQPFPTKPAPFDRQGIRADDLIDFTPALREEALRIVTTHTYGPLFTPPSEKGTIAVPGVLGGASWSGAAVDPTKGVLYVPSNTLPVLLTVVKSNLTQSDYDYAGILDFGLEGAQRTPALQAAVWKSHRDRFKHRRAFVDEAHWRWAEGSSGSAASQASPTRLALSQLCSVDQVIAVRRAGGTGNGCAWSFSQRKCNGDKDRGPCPAGP
jgi:quinoprotein glucose dehydrogenase